MKLYSDIKKSVPFQQYSLVESESPADLESAVSGAMSAAVRKEIAQHEFSFLDEYQRSRAIINCVRLKKTMLFGVCFGSDIHSSTASPINALQLVTPISGHIVSYREGKEYIAGPNESLLLKPNEPVDLDWHGDCVAIVSWVNQHLLNELALNLFGQSITPKITFPSHLKLNAGVGLSISNTLSTIVNELEDESSLFSRGITSENIEEILLTSILYASPDISELGKNAKLEGKSSLHSALEYIYSHIEDDIKLTDLVAATGVSLRKLQYDFSKELGVGPMAKIRQEKLNRVRDCLKKSNPQSTTVADVAAKWGFFDRRYFTKIYKNAFHELPSVTLSCSY